MLTAIVLAASFTPGNVLISTDELLYEYTTDGVFVQSHEIPYATGPYPVTESARDVAIDLAGLAHVYNGTQSETFLNLASSLSETMDMDHIATRCFAHWAGDESPWYDELRRATRYTHCLGRFVTVDEYFRDTYDPGIHDRFKADQYRSPWLQQQVSQQSVDPISGSTMYWRNYLRLQSWLSCSILWLLVQDCAGSRDQVTRAEAALDEFSRQPLVSPPSYATAEASQQLCVAATGLVTAVASASSAREVKEGCSLVNPWSFPRRMYLSECPASPAAEPPVYAFETTDAGPRVVADVPAMGLARLTTVTKTSRRTAKKPPPMAVDQTLRNEFLEAQLDPDSGGLAVLRDYRGRNNRLSQHVALRSRENGEDGAALYSATTCDSLQVTHADTIHGQIQTSGRLTNDNGSTLAEFVQTYDLWRGSRVLMVHVEIQLHVDLEHDPWNEYVASRFAWSSDAADLLRGLNDARSPTSAKRIVSPLFVHIDDGGTTTSILTGGLPFHRRVGQRLLDSILIVGNEQQRQFQFGIGLDLKQPFRDAVALMSPEVVVPLAFEGDIPPSMWLVHADARHVLCMLQQPVWQDDAVAGVRLRLIEVDGRAGRVSVTFFRALSSARKIDGLGQSVEVCEVDGSQTTVRVSPHEQIDVEVLFLPT